MKYFSPEEVCFQWRISWHLVPADLNARTRFMSVVNNVQICSGRTVLDQKNFVQNGHSHTACASEFEYTSEIYVCRQQTKQRSDPSWTHRFGREDGEHLGHLPVPVLGEYDSGEELLEDGVRVGVLLRHDAAPVVLRNSQSQSSFHRSMRRENA